MFFLLFTFFSWSDVHAAPLCQYTFDLWCADTGLTYGHPEELICKTTVTFLLDEIKGLDHSKHNVTINGNDDKYMRFKRDWDWDGQGDQLEKNEDVKPSDLENSCPVLYFVNTPASWGYTSVIVKKELAGTLPTNRSYSEIQRVVGRDASIELCSSTNYAKLYGEMSSKTSSLEAKLEDLKIESTSANPNNEKIMNQSNQAETDIDVIEGNLNAVRDTYSSCLENNPWSTSFGEGGTFEAKIQNLKKELDEILKNVNSNDNISEEAKKAVNDLVDRFNEVYREYNDGIGAGELPIDCGLLDPELVSTIQQIFDIVRLIVPIILVLFGSMDFGKAVIANDPDALKKAASSFLKRAVAAVIIFFLPTIIRYLLTLPGLDGLVSDDPLCQIR